MSADTLFKICIRFDLSADYILLGRTLSAHCQILYKKAVQSLPPSYIELTEEIMNAIEKVATWK